VQQTNTSTVSVQSILLPLFRPLQRGNQTSRPLVNPAEANYRRLIEKKAVMMASINALSAQSSNVGLELVAYDNNSHDPLGVIKLCMDALNGVYYVDDSLVTTASYKRIRPPKKKDGYAVVPYLEVCCSGCPAVRVEGMVRGTRYPLYTIQDLSTLEIEHTKVRQTIESILSVAPVQGPLFNQDVEAKVTIVQASSKGDIDNIMLNYWEALKKELSIQHAQITSLEVSRRPPSNNEHEHLDIELTYLP
jgi:Holliday junction resolvase RusA-like endonuclease